MIIRRLTILFRRSYNSTMSDSIIIKSFEEAGDYSKRNGRKDQSITKPISLDANTGEVLLRKGTGKTKIRKGQSDEEYKDQLQDYFAVHKGPKRTDTGWMTAEDAYRLLDSDTDLSIKLQRQKLTGFCHVLYYRRQYNACAELGQNLLSKYIECNCTKKISKEIQELEYIIRRSKEQSI